MPELPEVETVRGIIERAGAGKLVRAVQCFRPKLIETHESHFALEQLVGARLIAVERRAKYLSLRFDRDPQLVLHLRMTGQVAALYPDGRREIAGHPVPPYDAPLPTTVTHLIVEFDDGATVYLQDPRHFAKLLLVGENWLGGYLQSRRLGPEPFDPEVTHEWLTAGLARRARAKLKPLLLDQSFVAGLGNIYADEALHLARLHPERTAGSLDAHEVGRLHVALSAVLNEALPLGGARVRHGKATQVNGFPRVHARKGEPCDRCGTVIEKYTLAGRGTYWCPTCQVRAR